MDAVGEHRRHAAGLGRHDRQAARKRLENGRGHVVDVGCLDVDVGVRVVLPDASGGDAAGERHAAQAELNRKLLAGRLLEPPPTSVSVASGQRACTAAKARSVQSTL